MPQLTDLERQYVDALRDGDLTTAGNLEATIDAAQADREQRLRAPDALANAATWYASVGILVFPLKPGAKTPATRNGFHDATTDPDRVAIWWRTNPAYNIGLPTGHTFDVIDIDGPPGFMSFAQMREDGVDLGTPLGQVRTPRGRHIYIPVTRGGNHAGLAEGVDTRGRGGYVVAPPSLIDGKRYDWIEPLMLP